MKGVIIPIYRAVLLGLCIALAFAGVLAAQTSLGSVNGTVSDPTGAVVPQASVRLANQATGIASQTKTNERGYFVFLNVQPGSYTLRVEIEGFKSVLVPAFAVGVGAAATQNITLAVGALTETVDVTAASELIQASSADLGNVIERKVLRDLPLNGRNFTQLLVLTPGVNPVSTAQGSQTSMSFGAAEGNTGIPNSPLANASVQGQQNRSKVYYLDGIINTSVRGGTYVVLPDIDSLEEFKVQSHNDKAEYGGVAGGVVNMSSKAGTNNFHGSAFWFVRNEYFDARDPFRDATREKPLPFRQNQFGANIGGPVFRNKTFFFAGYDGWRYRDVANLQQRVPTDVELNGDFSQSPYKRDIYNPFTTRTEGGKTVRDIFAGRKIPSNLISPMMQGFFRTYYIKPNITGDPDYNFRQERARKQDANAFQARLDHHFSERDNVFFRWNEQYLETFNPFGDRGSKTPSSTNRNYGGGWLHAFSPAVIMDVRGGVATQPSEDAPLEHEAGIEPLKQLGFKDIDRYNGAMVTFSSSPWAVSGNLGTQGPRPRGNPNWNISSNLIWQRGTHSFKGGFQYVYISRLQENNFEEIMFDNVPTVNPQNVGSTGDNLAAALLGIPSQVRAYVPEYGSIRFHTATWSAFFQDEWKVRRNLTLTLGLRYDYVGKVRGEGLQSGPDMRTGEWLLAAEAWPATCSSSQAPPCLPVAKIEDVPFYQFIKLTGEPYSILKPIKDNWGPRVGFAWQPRNNLVVRGGYGIIWDALPSRSQYGQHQFETWGWPQASGFDTGSINRVGNPLQTLDDLMGNLPFAKPRTAPWATGTSAWFNAPDRKDGYSQQWHVEIQREFGRDLMMSVAYVGSQNGRLEYAGAASSAPRPGVDSAGRRLTAAEVNALRPWPHMTGSFVYSDSTNTSSYNSFQYKLQRRFSRGLTTLLSYTWQKSLDYNSGLVLSENGIGGDANIQNFHDRESNHAVSSYDVPQILTWATVWDLPFGQGKRWLSGGPAAAVLGNWQMNWMFLARSGQPYTIVVAGDVANVGNARTYMRANLVGDPRLDNPTAAAWFNKAAFATPVNSFGNAGRNILRTDGVWNADFGLAKIVRVTEGRELHFRAEAFNLFNHMDLGNPEVRIAQASAFGRITSVSHQPRQLQFGLRFVF